MTRAKTERLTGNRALVLGLVLAALMAAGLILAPKPALADATFIVTRTDDSEDPDPADGECGFFAGRGGRVCSLRAAIQQANASPGADTIHFGIPDDSTVPGLEIKTISPGSELPEITEALTIDGYTQPGATKNTNVQGAINADPKVELDGTSAGSADGLTILADDVVVRGLVINGFSARGIDIGSGTGFGTGARIEGNFIGTDPSGTQDRGNGSFGVTTDGGGTHTIGGTSPDKRNLISGNQSFAIEISSNSTGGNKVQGNLVGLGKDGSSNLGGSSSGLFVDAPNNTIGGPEPGAANVIAHHARNGVEVSGAANTGNRILSNSIFGNGDLGIDLDGGNEDVDGRTNNDPGDADTGPNDLQNFPVLTSAVSTEGSPPTIKGTLDSTPSSQIAPKKKKKGKKKGKKRKKGKPVFVPQTFTVQFFSNPQNEDEGKTFLGETRATTDLQGKASFTFQPSQQVRAGENITATATDASGNTSEFSDPMRFSTD